MVDARGPACIGLGGCHKESQAAEAKEEHAEEEEGPRLRASRAGPAEHGRRDGRGPGAERADPGEARDADARRGRPCRTSCRQAGRDGQEGPADRRARQVGGPRRPRREVGHERRPEGVAGAPQIGPRPEERKANELAVEQAKVALQRARQVRERLRPLLAQHEVSEQQVFEAELAVTTARLQQESAEARSGP